MLNNENNESFFHVKLLNNIRYMHVNFYKNTKIKTFVTQSKIEKHILFLDFLEQFISNSATKRVHGFGTVGLGKKYHSDL